MAGTDYYELLEVSRDASDEEIKKAYRRLARQHHPDANDGDPEAEARFKEVSLAYEVLRDPEKRRRYDVYGAEGAGASGFGAGGPGGFDFGVSDLFDAFFGQGMGGRGPAGPTRGADAEVRAGHRPRRGGVRRRQRGRGADAGRVHPLHRLGLRARHPPVDVQDLLAAPGEIRQVRRTILGQMMTAMPCNQCGGTGPGDPLPVPGLPGRGARQPEHDARGPGPRRHRRRPAAAARPAAAPPPPGAATPATSTSSSPCGTTRPTNGTATTCSTSCR